MADDETPEDPTEPTGVDPEMADDEPITAGDGPRLHVVGSPEVHPRGTSGRGIAMSPVMYERLWVLYRDGMREATRLAKATGVHRKTAAKAIHEGWPSLQFTPLRERVKFWDRQRAEEESKASAEKFREQVDELFKVRKRNLQYAAGTTGLGASVLRKLHQAFQGATFTKYRTVKRLVGEGKDAKLVEVDEAYVPGEVLIRAMRDVAYILKTMGDWEKFWVELGRTGALGTAAGPDGEDIRPLTPLTSEQVQFVLENDGALPAGVTDEQILAHLAALTAPKATG